MSLDRYLLNIYKFELITRASRKHRQQHNTTTLKVQIIHENRTFIYKRIYLGFVLSSLETALYCISLHGNSAPSPFVPSADDDYTINLKKKKKKRHSPSPKTAGPCGCWQMLLKQQKMLNMLGTWLINTHMVC